jgi:hypothetical protein
VSKLRRERERIEVEKSGNTARRATKRPSESHIAFERLFPTSVGKANSQRRVTMAALEGGRFLGFCDQRIATQVLQKRTRISSSKGSHFVVPTVHLALRRGVGAASFSAAARRSFSSWCGPCPGGPESIRKGLEQNKVTILSPAARTPKSPESKQGRVEALGSYTMNRKRRSPFIPR